MKVEIVTPDVKVFEGQARHVQLPGAKGLFGVLENHASIISTLIAGKVKVEAADGDLHIFNITGGVVEVNSNKVIVLAEKVL
ncbi:MAG: ATP synthase F1 subunit epsilon [Flavobacteriales bacterium]|nr:ATP synthase F1 subunit epsilon [Flavobacteriales bacterium]